MPRKLLLLAFPSPRTHEHEHHHEHEHEAPHEHEHEHEHEQRRPRTPTLLPTMADDPLEIVANVYRTDRPCVSDAMKSFCSVLAATELINADEHQTTHEFPHLLACAKVVLKHINALTLPLPTEWAEAHPQGDEESGTARMEAIANYKACHLLSTQLRQTAGAKATKMLGRRYLRTTNDSWPALRAAAAAELSGLCIPADTSEAFLDGWASAVAGEDEDLASLVWATDFQRELEARKKARLAEVRERRDRLTREEDEAALIRSAVAGAPAVEEDERIVELASGSDGGGGA